MHYNFDLSPIDRTVFARYNPALLKKVFGNSEILPFWIADSDFDVLPELEEALRKTNDRKVFGYELHSKNAKRALSEWFRSRHDLNLKVGNLLFTGSVLSSIAAIIEEFSDRGDGILIQPPVYQAFANTITLLKRKVVNNPLLLENGQYRVDFDGLEAIIHSSKPKIMLFCSPHNPVGRVWTIGELQRIADLCIQYNVLLISDEIHADVVYTGHQFMGMINVYNDRSDQVFMLGSAGKSFGIPGLVDSFIYTPGTRLKNRTLQYIEAHHLDKCNAFANAATECVYSMGDRWIDQFKSYLSKNIELIRMFCQTELPKLKLIEPEGTYQVWLDFRSFEMDQVKLMELLGKESGVGLNNGLSYGEEGRGFARMNIATSHKVVLEALGKIKSVFDSK